MVHVLKLIVVMEALMAWSTEIYIQCNTTDYQSHLKCEMCNYMYMYNVLAFI